MFVEFTRCKIKKVFEYSCTKPVEGGPPVPRGRGGGSWGLRDLMLRMKKILVFSCFQPPHKTKSSLRR